MNLKDAAYKTSINFEIKTYDIDIAGHLNNTVYVKWLEDLRSKFFEEYFSLKELLARKYYPIVGSTSISYKRQLKLYDKPAGFIWLGDLKHNVMMLEFKFINDEKICSVAEQKCILMNLKEDKMEKWREILASIDERFIDQPFP